MTILAERIEGSKEPPRTTQVPVTLQVRGSTRPLG